MQEGEAESAGILHVDSGQERSIIPTAQHTACTIEMTNLLKRVDVAVIDEIQVGLYPHPDVLHISNCWAIGCLTMEM